MTNRYKRAGIIRAAVQIASFIVLPGLFVEALSGVGALVTALATGTYPASLASQVVAAAVTIVAIHGSVPIKPDATANFANAKPSYVV